MNEIRDPTSQSDPAQYKPTLFVRLRRFVKRSRALFNLPDAFDAWRSHSQDQLKAILLQELDAQFLRIRGDLLDQPLTELKAEISSQLSFALHDFETVLLDQTRTLVTAQDNLSGQFKNADMVLQSRLNAFENERLPLLLSDLKALLEATRNAIFETTNRLIHLETSLHSRLNTLENERLSSVPEDILKRMKSETILNELGGLRDAVRNTAFETTNRLIHLETSLNSRLNTLENERLPSLAEDIQKKMQSETISNGLGSLPDAVRNIAFETSNRLIHLETSLNSRLNTLENERLPSLADDIQKSIQIAPLLSELRGLLEGVGNREFEAANRLIHLDTSLNSRLNTLENERLLAIAEELHQLTALYFELTASMSRSSAVRKPDPSERYQRAKIELFQALLKRAQSDFPKLFPWWLERLEATETAFADTKAGNAAHSGDSASRLFRSFVELHAIGRLLDVGCGIFGIPYYLTSYPTKLLSGLDPLQPAKPMPFEFVRGISEYLPWPDNSFSTVVSATSLDHCLSLEKSLAEICRVLRPNGRLLLWVGSIPGAPQYDPGNESFAPADRFHLFHFDVSWFEPLLDHSFDLAARVELRKKEYSHVMYSLVKR